VLDGPEIEAAAGGYLNDLLARDDAIDTLLLGCTHYPLLRPVIERLVGPRVAVVDSAFTTALAVEDLLDELLARSPDPAAAEHRVLTTGDVVAFEAVAGRVFGAELPSVEQVSVEQVEQVEQLGPNQHAAAPAPARGEAPSGTRR
jgi:glutamate racemase